MQEYIGKFFEKVNDPRSPRNQRHNFITLVGSKLAIDVIWRRIV